MKEYKHLELKNNKWKIKGRRLSVVDLVEGMKARGDSLEETCETFSLTPEELDEAIGFLTANPEEISKHFERSQSEKTLKSS